MRIVFAPTIVERSVSLARIHLRIVKLKADEDAISNLQEKSTDGSVEAMLPSSSPGTKYVKSEVFLRSSQNCRSCCLNKNKNPGNPSIPFPVPPPGILTDAYSLYSPPKVQGQDLPLEGSNPNSLRLDLYGFGENGQEVMDLDLGPSARPAVHGPRNYDLGTATYLRRSVEKDQKKSLVFGIMNDEAVIMFKLGIVIILVGISLGCESSTQRWRCSVRSRVESCDHAFHH